MEENQHSNLYYFFFADFSRITINLIVFFGIILFITVLYKAFTNKDSGFTFIFIVMINVMICALLSILGYIFNWEIEINETYGKLLFGSEDGFLCRFQSILLTYFQTARESLLTSVTIIVFINFCGKDIENNKIFRILIFIFCYGIPLISNIICFIFGGFGETDLFCFTGRSEFGRTFGILHFSYILTLIISNIILVLIILIMDYKQGKSNEAWLEEEKDSIKSDGTINSSVRKIAFYPIAQFICLFFPITYRIGNNSRQVGTNILLAQITAIGNSLSSILYAFIFVISNRMLFTSSQKKKDIEKEGKKSINEQSEGQMIGLDYI